MLRTTEVCHLDDEIRASARGIMAANRRQDGCGIVEAMKGDRNVRLSWCAIPRFCKTNWVRSAECG